MNYVIDRMSEASTWRGIFVFLAGLGAVIPADHQEAYIALGLGIAGVLGIFTKDREK